jgi:hypothetical protein
MSSPLKKEEVKKNKVGSLAIIAMYEIASGGTQYYLSATFAMTMF